MLAEGVVERPDGRVVAWTEWGVRGGEPVVRLHGSPGSRRTRPLVPGLYERIGVHVVTLDRPGYGGSTAKRDAGWLTCADDAIAVADAMGWETFRVIGGSGGGPHALAVGVRAPERVRALLISNPATPREFIDLDDLIELNAEAQRRTDEGRESLEAFMSPYVDQFRADALGTLEGVMADAPETDREALKEQERRSIFADAIAEALAPGPEGWYDDAWRLGTSWDFALEDVGVPVNIWYSADDRNTPASSIERMAAKLPEVSLERVPGGHMSDPSNHEREWRALLAA